MQAVPGATLTLCIVDSNDITGIADSTIDNCLIRVLKDNSHEAAIWTKVNAGVCVLRTWDVLDSLINQVPDGQAKLHVRNGEDLSAGWGPAAMS